MPDKEEKTCRGCGRVLPLDRFWKQKRGRDGYNPRCKNCLALTPGQREQQRATARQWDRDNRARANANKRAYKERRPERIKAKDAVLSALRRGVLVKEPCEVCGESDSQAHHDDYSKPLEVRWLCQAHHGEAHQGASR